MCIRDSFRGDIEVAGQHQLRAGGQLFADPGLQCRQPGQFVRVFFAADGLSVGDVGADDTNAIHRGSEQPLLWIGKIRVAIFDVARRLARQQGNAVVGLLPGENDLLTRCLNFPLREVVILELGFLQAHDIRLMHSKPFQQLWQAHLERVDVPCRNLH